MFSTRTIRMSRAAMLATCSIFASTWSAAAADLGGNCCADLEERVAELEATAARKGNRKVSLQIYGQVSESVIWWNDGAENNVYVVENQEVKNRLGFQGTAKINSDWSAGYKIELQVRAYRSSNTNQLALGASNGVQIPTYNTQSVSLREANWFIRSNTYGTVSVGRQTDAADGVELINLAEPDGFARRGNALGRTHLGFFLRRSGTTGNTGLSSLTWANAFHRSRSRTSDFAYSTDFSGVKYTSPFFLGQTKSAGFQVQTSWGMDDTFGIALRYTEQLGAFRLAAGIGYTQFTGPDILQCSNPSGAANVATTTSSSADCWSLNGSASLMHQPTGLYVSAGAGELVDNNRNRVANLAASGLGSRISDTDSMWWVQGGWVAKLNTLGSTTFWGNYASYTSHGNVANQALSGLGATDQLNSFQGAAASTVNVKTAESNSWGLGITQDIDAAAMKLYLGFVNSSADLTLINRNTLEQRKANSIDDIQTFYTGATIRF